MFRSVTLDRCGWPEVAVEELVTVVLIRMQKNCTDASRWVSGAECRRSSVCGCAPGAGPRRAATRHLPATGCFAEHDSCSRSSKRRTKRWWNPPGDRGLLEVVASQHVAATRCTRLVVGERSASRGHSHLSGGLAGVMPNGTSSEAATSLFSTTVGSPMGLVQRRLEAGVSASIQATEEKAACTAFPHPCSYPRCSAATSREACQ